MEKEKWIENVVNSTNGITSVVPADNLFSKIELRIQENKVSAKTLWLVAASIAALVLLNFSVINSKSKHSEGSTASYFEMTFNQNNQLYQ